MYRYDIIGLNVCIVNFILVYIGYGKCDLLIYLFMLRKCLFVFEF